MKVAILDNDIDYLEIFKDEFLNHEVKTFTFPNEFLHHDLDNYDVLFIDHLNECEIKGFDIAQILKTIGIYTDIIILHTNKVSEYEGDIFKHIVSSKNIITTIEKYNWKQIKNWAKYAHLHKNLKHMASNL
jgi:hypothetical protein